MPDKAGRGVVDQVLDREVELLRLAKARALQEYTRNPSSATLRSYEDAERKLQSRESPPVASGSGVRTFPTLVTAAQFLTASGYKCGKSRLSRDLGAGLLARNERGELEEGALLAYAVANVKPAGGHLAENAGGMADKVSADAELKRVQTERLRVKLATERGEMIERAQYEADLAARAQFMATEHENFALRQAPLIIALVGGDESKIGELRDYMLEEFTAMREAWAQDREFVVELPDEEAPVA